eukprot:sb/3467339/
MNVAVCDFLTGLIAQPIMLLNITVWDEEFHHNYPGLCNYFSYISASLCYVSFFTIAGIAIDRCLVVWLTHKYKYIVSKQKMLLSIAFIWIIAFFSSYPIPKIYCPSYEFQYRRERMMCVAADNKSPPRIEHFIMKRDQVNWTDDLENNFTNGEWLYGFPQKGCKKIVAFVEAIALLAVPLCIVIATGVVLIVRLSRRMCSQSDVVRRSVETVVIMMLGFSVCVLPYCVTVGFDPATLGGDPMLIMIFLMQLHSTINPTIYLWRSSKFRMQARELGSEIVRSFDHRGRVRRLRMSIKRMYD